MKKIQFEVTEKDIEGYAGLSGDFNPIHLDQEYAVTHGFENKIAHGMLTMAKVWGMITNELESVLLPTEYQLTFQSPVYVGSTSRTDNHRKRECYPHHWKKPGNNSCKRINRPLNTKNRAS